MIAKLFRVVVKNLVAVKASPQCIALGTTCQDDINGLLAVVENLSRGKPPDARHLKSVSSLAKLCLKRCENLIRVTVDEGVGPHGAGCGLAMPKQLYGLDALQYMFSVTEKQAQAGTVPITLEEITILRTFEWVWSAPQLAMLEGWFRIACKTAVITKRALKDGPPTTSKGAEVVAHCSSATIAAMKSAAPSTDVPTKAKGYDQVGGSTSSSKSVDPKQKEDTLYMMFKGMNKKQKL